MVMLAADGSLGEDNIGCVVFDDAGAGKHGAVLEIDDAGVSCFSGVGSAGNFEVLTLVCFNLVSRVEEGLDWDGFSWLPDLERGGPAVSVPGMDLVAGTGGLRRLWVALFSLDVSGDDGGLALRSMFLLGESTDGLQANNIVCSTIKLNKFKRFRSCPHTTTM